MRRRITALLLLISLVQGCTLGPDFKAPKADLPARWQAVDGRVNPQWWASFNDPQLSALMAQALAGNLDLAIAASHVQQSQALRATVAADRVPAVNASGSYQRARNSQDGLMDISGYDGKQAYSVWNAGLSISWEADLWGRVRRSVEAADASVQAVREQQHGLQVAIMALTARDYIELRGTQSALQVTRDNLAIARRTLTLTQAQRTQGVATDLQVAQAQALSAAIEARLPDLEQRESVLINALSLLVGQPPETLEGALQAPAPVPHGPAQVPAGLPSELAQRRPDIREAEARLHAATAAIGVAQADFYPRITLGADVGLQALQLANLGNWASRSFAAGPGISLPLFEGGRLQGALRLSEGRQQEAAIAYRKTVLGAWHEVADALSAYQARQRRQASLDQAVEASQRALHSAQLQYDQGSVDFLNVLNVQTALLDNQAAQVANSALVALALVDLYRSLGGGWQATPQGPPSA
ncbi:efflux transporter outer membrane subunit [Pseudomonas sp. TE3610]